MIAVGRPLWQACGHPLPTQPRPALRHLQPFFTTYTLHYFAVHQITMGTQQAGNLLIAKCRVLTAELHDQDFQLLLL